MATAMPTLLACFAMFLGTLTLYAISLSNIVYHFILDSCATLAHATHSLWTTVPGYRMLQLKLTGVSTAIRPPRRGTGHVSTAKPVAPRGGERGFLKPLHLNSPLRPPVPPIPYIGVDHNRRGNVVLGGLMRGKNKPAAFFLALSLRNRLHQGGTIESNDNVVRLRNLGERQEGNGSKGTQGSPEHISTTSDNICHMKSIAVGAD